MSILSTLNKLTGKSDKSVLAALNSLTGKTADDIEEAVGNLSAGSTVGPEYTNPKELALQVYFNNKASLADFSAAGYDFRSPEVSNVNASIPFSPIFSRSSDPTCLDIVVKVAAADVPDGVDPTGKTPSGSWLSNRKPYDGFPDVTAFQWQTLSDGSYSCTVRLYPVDFAKITRDYSTLKINTIV